MSEPQKHAGIFVHTKMQHNNMCYIVRWQMTKTIPTSHSEKGKKNCFFIIMFKAHNLNVRDEI